MIFIIVLFIVVAVLASIIIVLAAPNSGAGKWISKAWQDLYSFAYQEIGTVLGVLKYNAGPVPGTNTVLMKYSAKRVIGVILIVDGLISISGGIPAALIPALFAAGKIVVGATLIALGGLTKS